jgi:uncharacterized repeat protein (TIGR02059 family)
MNLHYFKSFFGFSKKTVVVASLVASLALMSFVSMPHTAQAVGTINVGTRPAYPILVGTTLYEINYTGNTVSAIDTNPANVGTYNTVIATIPVGVKGKNPILIGSYLYVLNSGGNTISVIDTNPANVGTYNTVVTTITTDVSSTAAPSYTALIGTNLYVVNHNANNVVIVDVNPANVGTTFNTIIGSSIAVGSLPQFPNIVGNRYIYIPNIASNSVSVIDSNSNTVIATLTAGSGYTSGIGHYPGYYSAPTTLVGGRYLYMLNLLSNNVSVIDTTNNTVAAVVTLPVGAQPGYKSMVVGTDLYVLDGGDTGGINKVSIIDVDPASPTYNTDVVDLPTGSAPEQMVLVGQYVYIVNYTDHTLTVVDSLTRTVFTTINVGRCPWFPVIIGTEMYVLNAADNTVSVVDVNQTHATFNTVIDTIPVGIWPFFSVLSGSNLYVANFKGTTVSSIDIGRPVLQSAVATNGTTLTLRYNKALDATSIPVVGDFTVMVNGTSDTVANTSVVGSTVVLTLTTPTIPSDALTVSYVQPVPEVNPIKTDLQAAAFSGYAVTNNNTWAVTYTTSDGGALTGTATQAVLQNGTSTGVTAVPNNGYHFNFWSDGLKQAYRADGPITNNFSVGASFAESSLIPLSIIALTSNQVSTPAVDLSVNVKPLALSLSTSITNSGGSTFGVFTFTRDLKKGISDGDVAELQRFLAKNGFPVAATGAGSFGQPTKMFGVKTARALKLYQASVKLPATGYFGKLTRAKINSVLGGAR